MQFSVHCFLRVILYTNTHATNTFAVLVGYDVYPFVYSELPYVIFVA
uniref:Uncharacterized protein n=1 Tax=Rhizophora mucronata TaxID=61149 RepID=A0A2P2J016_RHIMU